MRFFSTTRTAAALCAAILIALIIGSLLPPKGAWDWVYGTFWFNCILSLFCLNIVACRIRKFPRHLNQVGSFALHLSFILILTGVITGHLWGANGFLQIRKGEISSVFDSGEGPEPFGFQVRLDDFSIERYKTGQWGLNVQPSPETPEYTIVPEAGMEYPIPHSPYSIRVRALRESYGKGEAATTLLRPPALLMEIRGVEDGAPHLLAAEGVENGKARLGGNIPPGMRISYEQLPGRVKQYMSRITILDHERPLLTGTVSVNTPLNYGGFSFYQMSYDEKAQQWSGLGVKKNPGIPLVYTGFALLAAGITLAVMRSLRQRKPQEATLALTSHREEN